MKLRNLLILAFCFLTGAGFSQSISASLRIARNSVDKGDYEVSAIEYSKVLAQDSNHLRANLEYGLLLFEFLNEPEKAGRYLLKAEKYSLDDTMPEIFFGLGRYYHFIGDHNLAISYYQKLIPYIQTRSKDGKILESEVNRSIASCRYALQNNLPANDKISIRNLGPGVNTLYPEYVPVISADGNTLMFTSRRKIPPNPTIQFEEGGFYEDMFIAERDKEGNFPVSKAFSLHTAKLPGKGDRHESVVSLSFVGDKFYTFFDGKIYQSSRINNDWGEPVLLSDSMQVKEEFINHICISKDGNTMYFSADRSDALGGLDLYKREKKDGKWGPEINLGTAINTIEDEGSPQLNAEENTLYFSSKGHPGYGGYDIFKTSLTGGNLGTPVNMGIPFNSPGDDIYLLITNPEETKGFFSSSRPGGYGDMDIYEIGFKKPFIDFKPDTLARITIALPDTVFLGEEKDLAASHEAIPAGSVKNYYWQVADSVLNPEGGAAKYRFDKPGAYVVRVQAETMNNELVGGERKVTVIAKPMVVASTTTTATGTVSAVSELPALETIYFDLNRADVNEAAALALDRNIELLKKYKAQIEILAYCDSRGAAAYNRALSQRRAIATLNYLKKNGVSIKMIKKTSGLGENNLVNRCAEGVDCTEEEHKMNRRVEIKWVEIKR